MIWAFLAGAATVIVGEGIVLLYLFLTAPDNPTECLSNQAYLDSLDKDGKWKTPA